MSLPAAAATLHGGEAGVKALIKDILATTPPLRTSLVETALEEKQLKINVVVTFDNALDLMDLSSPSSLEKIPSAGVEFMGKTDIEFQGLSLVFSRRIELAKAIPGAIFIPRSKFAGHGIKTTIHLPKAATSHNATSVADGGRTLIWATPLAIAVSKPMEAHFTMPLPIPWAFFGFVLFLILLLLGALIYYIRRRKKSQTIPSL
jgi:hypothetical protein